MTLVTPPALLLEPEQLRACLADPTLLIVDLSDAPRYAAGHIPHAVRLDYACLVPRALPVMGFRPNTAQLSTVLTGIGLTPDRHVVAYDAEGNGRASRLLWTLVTLGHTRTSLLNGGIHAWMTAGGAISTDISPAPSTQGEGYTARVVDPPTAMADRSFILSRLGHPECVLLDVRTPAEYMGMDQRAARAGHIPGAVHFNWADTLDPARQLRLQPASVLRQVFDMRGVTTDKEVIVYSHALRRAAHTYWVLRYLNYPRVRSYPGGWSEWGNDPSVPIEA